jgi:hypothetical protein
VGIGIQAGRKKGPLDFSNGPAKNNQSLSETFDSGNSTRIDYDGGNPRRDNRPIVQTGKQNDTVKEIKVVRVRD